MKARIVPVIICLALLWLTSYLVLVQTFPVRAAVSTSAPAVSIDASPSPTLTKFLTDQSDLGIAFLRFFAVGLLLILLIFLLVRIVILLVRRLRTTNVVLDPFNNATGNADLDKVLPGLNPLTREQLAPVIEDVRKRYNDPPPQFPPPQQTSGDQLDTLLDSLTKSLSGDSFKSGELQSALQLLGLVVTPRGTRITITLQSKGDTPATLGMSIELADLQGNQEPTLRTIWEPPLSDGSSSSQPVAPTGSSGSSGSSAPQNDRQQAELYYGLGMKLDAAGLYEDAISYFEEALKHDKTFGHAASDLSTSVSHLQAQQKNLSTYTIGKQFQDAGLLSRAIEYYKQSLMPEDQDDAEKAWGIVLDLQVGDKGNAYLRLAQLYWKDHTYLIDQSLNLYKEAITHGSLQAAGELKALQQTGASLLTEVGEILNNVKQYDAAEKYLMNALGKVPNDPLAQKELAVVKQHQQPKIADDAVASYTLGQLYQARGALDEAKSQYEAALTKQPDYEKAADALKQVLQQRLTIEERYLVLRKPAARWLAIEFFKRSMVGSQGKSNHALATLYNFTGSFHQSSAETYYSYPFFYERAIEDFEAAKKRDPGWFQPYENLADTYIMMVQGVIVDGKPVALKTGNDALDCLYKALHQYKKALELYKGPPDEQQPDNRRRIQINEAIAQVMAAHLMKGVLTSHTDLMQQAIDTIDRVMAVKEPNMEQPEWVIEWDRERDPKQNREQVLYNLACWYGVALSSQCHFTDAKQNARRYLAYSMARDQTRQLWSWAFYDPSFVDISDTKPDGLQKDLNRLSLVLSQKIYLKPELPTMSGEQFVDVMDDVLREVKWLEGGN